MHPADLIIGKARIFQCTEEQRFLSSASEKTDIAGRRSERCDHRIEVMVMSPRCHYDIGIVRDDHAGKYGGEIVDHDIICIRQILRVGIFGPVIADNHTEAAELRSL